VTPSVEDFVCFVLVSIDFIFFYLLLFDYFRLRSNFMLRCVDSGFPLILVRGRKHSSETNTPSRAASTLHVLRELLYSIFFIFRPFVSFRTLKNSSYSSHSTPLFLCWLFFLFVLLSHEHLRVGPHERAVEVKGHSSNAL